MNQQNENDNGGEVRSKKDPALSPKTAWSLLTESTFVGHEIQTLKTIHHTWQKTCRAPDFLMTLEL